MTRVWYDDGDLEPHPAWELFWAGLYLILGGAIVLGAPHEDGGRYILVGGAACLAGLVFLIRFTMGWISRAES